MITDRCLLLLLLALPGACGEPQTPTEPPREQEAAEPPQVRDDTTEFWARLDEILVANDNIFGEDPESQRFQVTTGKWAQKSVNLTKHLELELETAQGKMSDAERREIAEIAKDLRVQLKEIPPSGYTALDSAQHAIAPAEKIRQHALRLRAMADAHLGAG